MTEESTSRFDPAYGLRAEFGQLARNSGRLLNERGSVERERATNLLGNAMNHLAGGNPERAEALVARAAALTWSDREEVSPGIDGATMLLYTLVSDRLEASPPGVESWLDVALEAYEFVDGPGKAALASILYGFVLQQPMFELDKGESRRIREVVGKAPLEADLGDGPTISTETKQSIVWSLVTLAVDLQARYDAMTA